MDKIWYRNPSKPEVMSCLYVLVPRCRSWCFRCKSRQYVSSLSLGHGVCLCLYLKPVHLVWLKHLQKINTMQKMLAMTGENLSLVKILENSQ